MREDLLYFVANIARVFQRRALRSLNDHHDVSLVIFRDKAARHDLVNPIGQAQERKENYDGGESPADHTAHDACV